MQCQLVVNTYELESAAREHYNSNDVGAVGAIGEGSSSDAAQRRYWEEVIVPRLAARRQTESATISTATPSDLYTMGRIARFHRGCRSAKEFRPWRHHDTRCFAVGSMAMRHVCEEALAEGAATAASDSHSVEDADGSHEGKVIEYVILRDKFEGKPHPWRVLSSGAGPVGGDDGSAALRSLLKNQHDKLDLPALLTSSSLLQPLHQRSAFPLWNVSLSHHGPLVAVASHPTKAVGIDVMTIETTPPLLPFGKGEDGEGQVDPNYPSHAYYRRCAERHWTATDDEVGAFFEDFAAFFTKEEWVFIRSGGASIRNGQHNSTTKSPAFYQLKRFHTLWTLKESYIKAIGIGLGLDLQRARFEVVGGPANDTDGASSTSSSALPPTFTTTATTTVLHLPHHIALFIDGVPQRDWCFTVYDLGDALNAVVAIAEGPMDIAARHSCWGRCVLSEAATIDPSSSPSPSLGATSFPSLPRPLQLMSLKALVTHQ